MEHADPATNLPETRTPPRRPFFRFLTAVLGAVGAAMAGIPIVSYLVRQRSEKVIWVPMGKVTDFPVNETREITFDNPLRQTLGRHDEPNGRVRAQNVGPAEGKDDSQFLVFAVNCAHLGCPVSWFPQSGLFLCPCHGGVYYGNGERASGPPPRGLYHCVWRVKGGVLEIQAPHYPTLQDTLQDTA